MEDTARTDALAVARLLEEHRSEDVLVLDVGEAAGWTDYFVIATVESSSRRRGVLRAVGAYLEARDIPPLNRLQREEEGWILLDCGRLVIHLMDPEHRAFYELEKLWFRSQELYSSNSSRFRSSSSS